MFTLLGTIKDRNGMYLKQKILRRGGKNTQNNSKKISMTQITIIVLSLTYHQILWRVKSSGM